MLKFTRVNGNYLITEIMLGWVKNRVKTVEYTPDLMQHRVNAESWRATAQSDRDWFNKYHRKHYEDGYAKAQG